MTLDLVKQKIKGHFYGCFRSGRGAFLLHGQTPQAAGRLIVRNAIDKSKVVLYTKFDKGSPN